MGCGNTFAWRSKSDVCYVRFGQLEQIVSGMHSFPRMFLHCRLPRSEAEATGVSGPFVMRCVVCCAGICCGSR